jgi:hypothetical protein
MQSTPRVKPRKDSMKQWKYRWKAVGKIFPLLKGNKPYFRQFLYLIIFPYRYYMSQTSAEETASSNTGNLPINRSCITSTFFKQNIMWIQCSTHAFCVPSPSKVCDLRRIFLLRWPVELEMDPACQKSYQMSKAFIH